MLRLQDTKKGLADAALGEGEGIKLHKLSVREVKAVCCDPGLFTLPLIFCFPRFSCLE